MTIKIITSFETLMKYAGALGKAKKSGNIKEIKDAQKQLDDYKEICLKSDEMSTGINFNLF